MSDEPESVRRFREALAAFRDTVASIAHADMQGGLTDAGDAEAEADFEELVAMYAAHRENG